MPMILRILNRHTADSSALEAIKKSDKYKEFKNNISEYKTYDEAILDMKAGRIKAVASTRFMRFITIRTRISYMSRRLTSVLTTML